MSTLADDVKTATNSILESTKGFTGPNTLRAEMGAILNRDLTDLDLTLAQEAAVEILRDTMLRLKECDGDSFDPVKAGKTGSAVVFLTGIAVGVVMGEARKDSILEGAQVELESLRR